MFLHCSFKLGACITSNPAHKNLPCVCRKLKTLHPQQPLYRELVPQLLSHAVLLIAIKWIFFPVPYCSYYEAMYLLWVDEQVTNYFTHTTTTDHWTHTTCTTS